MFLHLIDRETARRFGLKRFFTGKPCGRGGLAQRMTGNGTCCCSACMTAKRKAHAEYRNGPQRERLLQAKRDDYAANADEYKAAKRQKRRENPEHESLLGKIRRERDPEKHRIKSRENYAKHREKRNAASRRSHRENREERRLKQAQYTKRNPQIFHARNAKRRAIQQGRTPKWFGEFDQFVMREASSLRKMRKAATGFAWEVDHCIPLMSEDASGLHCGHNLQVIPAYHNQAKNNKLMFTEPLDWLEY